MSNNYLIHIGNKNSGRYPRGSGENPHQHDGFFARLFGIKRKKKEPDSEKKVYTQKDMSEDLSKRISDNPETMKRITENSSKMNDLQSELSDDYRNAYKEMKTLSPEQKSRIEKKLNDEFGKGCDDEWWYNEMVEEHVSSEIASMIPKSVQEKRQKFDSVTDNYWKDVYSITDGFVNKYKGKKVKDQWGYVVVGDEYVGDNIISNKLDTRFNAYLSKHFDDYWVNDVDTRYEAIDRLKKDFGMSMIDYNKKYGK